MQPAQATRPCTTLSELKPEHEAGLPKIEGRKVRILSIDGGGVRGIIPSRELEWLERNTHKRVSELFDLVIGTSTGGIGALALTVPESEGSSTPKFTAGQVVELYKNKAAQVFPQPSWWQRPFSLIWDVERSEYNPDGLTSVMKEYCGDTLLKDALTEVIVPSQEITESRPWYFQRSIARVDPTFSSLKMVDVIRCGTAAPTYFPPNAMTFNDIPYAFIDGGVCVNTPSVSAFTEAKNLFKTDDCIVVSLGTGTCTQKIPYDGSTNWGLAKWAPRIVNLFMQSQSELAHKQMQTLMPGVGSKQTYFRFQAEIPQKNVAMDNASPENMLELEEIADGVLEEQSDQFNLLVEKLTQPVEL